MPKPTLIRITTVPLSLNVLLKGQLRFMQQHFEVLAVASGPAEELMEVEKREGVPTVQVEMTRAITPLKDVKAVWQLYKLFKKQKPHMVHTHTPKAGTVGMLAAKLAGVPHRLHTVAGLPLLETTGAKRKLLDTVEKFTYACATKVYPNSKGLYDIILQNRYTNPEKLRVIADGSSNGIDTTHFSPEQITQNQKAALKNELAISDSDFVFVFVGRLVGDKGINELVSAFTRLSNQPLTTHDSPLTTHKLLLVGPLEPELDPLKPETLHEIENNPNILSVGFQKDVRPYLAISHALAFPSYREGFPNVVMQAGAMGLPAIVTNINGCNEIVEDGKNGLIIPAKAGISSSPDENLTQALRHAMQQLSTNTPLYNHLQHNARPMICNRYEQRVVWEAILEEYRLLLQAD